MFLNQGESWGGVYFIFIFIFYIPEILFVCPSVCISAVLRKTYLAKCD